MNKVKILAVAGLTSVAFAGGNLWDFSTLVASTNEPFFAQVHTPGAIWCWQENAPTADNGYGEPCYGGATGGWWFGYGDAGGITKDADSGKDLTECGTDIVIEKYISATDNQDWKDKTVVGSGAVTNGKHYLIKGYGLGNGANGFDVNFTNSAANSEDPSVSAIGFNWRGSSKPLCDGTTQKGDIQDIPTENLSVKEGLCIVYKADKGDAEVGVDVELGWNENQYEYNTWIVRLPVANDWKTLDMKWEDFALSYETEVASSPIETALTEAEALKFAFKNKTASPVSIHFQLKEVGWFGSCSGTAERPPIKPTPIIGSKMASAYKFSMNGHMLSANFAGSVQVINMQGMVVAKKTLAAGESLNLANLPVGIYMVRSEKLGIVQKIMVK